MNPPRTIAQMAELLGEQPTTVRRALDRARKAGLPAPEPTGQAGNAATYDPVEFHVWWNLQRPPGRPARSEADQEDPLALTYQHIEVARMLAEWVRSGAGREISIEARARRSDAFAMLIERAAQDTGNTSATVRDAIAVLRAGESPASKTIKFRVHQHFYRELGRSKADD